MEEKYSHPSTVRDATLCSPVIVEPYNEDFAVKINGVLRNPNGLFPNIAWPNGAGKLKTYGDTFKFTPTDAAAGTFTRSSGNVLTLLQWHIHAPSEHRVNGITYPAEVHCNFDFFTNI